MIVAYNNEFDKRKLFFMRIIDAHLHFWPGEPYFDEIARNAGHKNTEVHLHCEYEKWGIVAGIVMGNRGLSLEAHQYPNFLRYCIGLDHDKLKTPEDIDLVESHLQRDICTGIKLYPGYHPFYITDSVFEPVYALAEKYRKPVAIHMGVTAGNNALLKYTHPLTLDEAAVKHPNVQFVMCHFGNPWLADAAAVTAKNDNVAADLSGLLEGHTDLPKLMEEQKGYFDLLRTWIAYTGHYERFLFGTDWPLANLKEYIDLTLQLIPSSHWDEVFFANANRIYHLGL